MGLSCHPFDLYVQNERSSLRVVHAALLFALDRHPGLCVSSYIDRLDALAARVASNKPRTVDERIAAMRRVLVEQEGLRGRAADFCDPNSSYLNRVLDVRHGLPIALSAIWLDVARTLNWPFHGVGMPGHFLIACCADDRRSTGDAANDSQRRFVDPFGAGAVLDRAGCSRLLARCFGKHLDLAEGHLAPVSDQAILTRMLCNLRSLYCASQHWRDAERVLQRLLALRPDNAELREEIREVRRLGCEQN